MVSIYRKGDGTRWWVEDLGETGTIGIGARAGSFICAKIYHLSFIGPKAPRPRFRAVIPGLASQPCASLLASLDIGIGCTATTAVVN
jgi:hypothetical protein